MFISFKLRAMLEFPALSCEVNPLGASTSTVYILSFRGRQKKVYIHTIYLFLPLLNIKMFKTQVISFLKYIEAICIVIF